MANGVYRKDPLFLAICTDEPMNFAQIELALSEFFDIDSDELLAVQTERTVAFYVRGYYAPAKGSFVNFHDQSVLTVSSHIVYETEQLSDPVTGLTKLFSQIHTGERAIADFSAPLAMFQFKPRNESIVCYNDAFGFGRIYYARLPGMSIVANSIPAVAIARGEVCTSDQDYWATYHCGGVTGENTYIQGVSLAPPNCRIVIKPNAFSIKVNNIAEQLLRSRNSIDHRRKVVRSLGGPLRAVAEAFPNSQPTVGLSGGRDSRLVAALSLYVDCDCAFRTSYPPVLEVEIVEQLLSLRGDDHRWERVPATSTGIDPLTGFRIDVGIAADAPLAPLQQRVSEWFAFTGGDNWSTFARTNPPLRDDGGKVPDGIFVTGMGGETTRGSWFLEEEAKVGNTKRALQRYIDLPKTYWPLLPEELRERASQLRAGLLLEGFIEGFEGFDALDYAQLMSNYRRSIPTPSAGVVSPLFSLPLAEYAFGFDPLERIRSKPLRELTEFLVPEWKGIPYYHEVAERRDDPKDNKVTIQPTHWEVNQSQFLEAMEEALASTKIDGLDMASVEREIETPSDGRNRTNTLFETILWRNSAEQQISALNRLLRQFDV